MHNVTIPNINSEKQYRDLVIYIGDSKLIKILFGRQVELDTFEFMAHCRVGWCNEEIEGLPTYVCAGEMFQMAILG